MCVFDYHQAGLIPETLRRPLEHMSEEAIFVRPWWGLMNALPLLLLLKAVPALLKLPATGMWVDYDAEADVLCLSLQWPQRATDSEMRKDGIIIYRHGKRIVGVTVLEASTR